jgi:hypothetical protein
VPSYNVKVSEGEMQNYDASFSEGDGGSYVVKVFESVMEIHIVEVSDADVGRYNEKVSEGAALGGGAEVIGKIDQIETDKKSEVSMEVFKAMMIELLKATSASFVPT